MTCLVTRQKLSAMLDRDVTIDHDNLIPQALSECAARLLVPREDDELLIGGLLKLV
jgi:predicted anti-sigma-YlaC factor YlaD